MRLIVDMLPKSALDDTDRDQVPVGFRGWKGISVLVEDHGLLPSSTEEPEMTY